MRISFGPDYILKSRVVIDKLISYVFAVSDSPFDVTRR